MNPYDVKEREGFAFRGDELACEGVPLGDIAAAVGTPVYVYSAPEIRRRYRELDDAFDGYPHAIHYALKANSALAMARLLYDLGSGADANSFGEIEIAIRAGFAPKDIVFTGVGKSAEELGRTVPMGLKAVNVESAGELDRIESLARSHGRPVRIAIRINPDIDAKSHPHISTGLRVNKFGVPADEARELIATIRGRMLLQLVAVHVHVGSQITDVEPFERAAAFLAAMAAECAASGVPLQYLDAGGGLGIRYGTEAAVSPSQFVHALLGHIRQTALPLVIEPGRALVGPAGVLLARVVDLKPRNATSEFAVIDAGMTELMRPALYGAYHGIEPVHRHDGSVHRLYEVVGPVCESSDVVGRDRELPRLTVGDLLAIRDAGAYGSAMASNYLRRPFPAEVMVDGGTWRVIRRRQTIDDLLALEC